jgi:hypothetical protein
MRSDSRLCCLFGLVLLLAIGAGASEAAEEPPSLDELAFMTGSWSGRSGSVEMEEMWTSPKGGVMLGLHRDVTPGKPAFFEFLRIEERNGRVIYIASPKGRGGTEFPLAKIEDSVVVFENLEHDYPQRIIYQRDGESLTARIEGVVDGKLESTEWSWSLVR